jgi:hypothetical protein
MATAETAGPVPKPPPSVSSVYELCGGDKRVFAFSNCVLVIDAVSSADLDADGSPWIGWHLTLGPVPKSGGDGGVRGASVKSSGGGDRDTNVEWRSRTADFADLATHLKGAIAYASEHAVSFSGISGIVDAPFGVIHALLETGDDAIYENVAAQLIGFVRAGRVDVLGQLVAPPSHVGHYNAWMRELAATDVLLAPAESKDADVSAVTVDTEDDAPSDTKASGGGDLSAAERAFRFVCLSLCARRFSRSARRINGYVTVDDFVQLAAAHKNATALRWLAADHPPCV